MESHHKERLQATHTKKNKVGATRKKLTCTFTNAQSITNKRNLLEGYIEQESPDIIGIVETWLTSDTSDAEIQFPGYQTTRLDRQNKAHGGILLYTKFGIVTQIREDPSLEQYAEALWCDISCPGTELDLLVGVVYRSPYNTDEQNDSLNNVLTCLTDEKKDIMIMGDFNFREISWETMQAGSGKSEAFLDVILDNLWYQHVTKPTRLNSLLDLVITSNPDAIDEVDVQAHLGRSDHNVIKWDMNYLVELENPDPKRDYKNANYDKMKDKLRKVKWSETLASKSAEQAWTTTRDLLKQLIQDHVPMKAPPRKKKSPWLTKRAQRVLRRKQRAWKKYQNRKTTKTLEHYANCQREAKYEVRKAKRDFEKKLAQNIKEDSKSFYAYVRSKQKVKDAIGPLKTDIGELIPPGQKTADTLNDFFASVFTEENQETPTPESIYKGPTSEKLCNINITEERVKEKLLKLDASKAAGPDDIPPSVLKHLADELCTPLAHIFQLSLEEGYVPSDWRIAHIIPIFKKGSRSKPGNYRPISLTSCIGKVLERIIKDDITDHLEKHDLLHNTQHGFRKGRSCTTNLLEYLEIITKIVDEGTPVDVVYLDLAKAFDTVPHNRLLAKIKAHGIDGTTLRWIEAWLADRKQKVVTQGAESGWKKVTSSVVQGSVLGPLCFLIYMDDLECGVCPTASVSKFADDTKLIHPAGSDSDIQDMQSSIDHLQKWAEEWQMTFNADKCGVMHAGYHNQHHTYHLGSSDLKETTEEKDLGVLINKSLKTSSQCAAAAKKGNRALGLIKRTFAYRSREVILKLYKSLVRPHLDYAVQAWNPHLEKDKKVLENVQRRATKLIPALRDLPYEERLTRLHLTTHETRRERADLLQTYRIMNQIDRIDPDAMFTKTGYQGTRGHSQKLAKSRPRLDIRKHFYSQRVVDTWNKLPESAIKAPTLLCFKTNLNNLGY